MGSFEAKRIVRELRQEVSVSAAEVFPLLCPVREYDWIDGWDCEMIYSKSGVAENNCIFRTHLMDRGEEVWVVSRYDPENFAIEFATFNKSGVVMKLDVSVEEHENRGSTVSFQYTFTGINEEGNNFVEAYTEEKHRERTDFLGKSLEHYCSTGKLLKMPSIRKGLHSLWKHR